MAHAQQGKAGSRSTARELAERVPLRLHVGLPKTATTLMQSSLFPEHREVEYLGTWHTREYRRFDKFQNAVVQAAVRAADDRGTSEQELERCRAAIDEQLAPARAAGKVPVFSWETLMDCRPDVRERRAAAWAKAFGPCRVMITIRNPLSFVESMYFQLLRAENVGGAARRFGGPRYRTVDQWLDKAWDSRRMVPKTFLQYAETAEMYARIFGRQSVGLFVFEEFPVDPAGYVKAVSQFLGIDGDESAKLLHGKRRGDRWTEGQIAALQHVSRSPWQSLKFRLADNKRRRQMLGITNEAAKSGRDEPKARADFGPAWRKKIEDFTRPGNRLLVEEWGLDLSRHGYAA